MAQKYTDDSSSENSGLCVKKPIFPVTSAPPYEQVPDLSIVDCEQKPTSEPIIRGYFTDWLVYNTGLPTGFPGYGPVAVADNYEVARQANTADVGKILPYINSIVYSFLEVKQDADSSVGSYTTNPSYLGNVMFFDPWSDFRKPENFQWSENPAATYPSIKWMNDHKGYFVDEAGGREFDPTNPNFPYDFLNFGNFEAFVDFKNGAIDEPEKIIAIGGYGDQYRSGWRAAVDHPTRFAQSIIDISKHFDLDGVDLDWEPLSDIYNYGDHTAADMITLAKAIRGAAQAEGMHDFLISFPITVDHNQIAGFNDSIPTQDAWAQLMKYVDHIPIMGYDMHGAFDNPKLTGLQSALYPVPCDSTEFSVDRCVETLHNFGVPYESMILGVPTYARIVEGVAENGLMKSFTGPFRGDIDVPAPATATGVTSYKWLMANVDSSNIYDVTTEISAHHKPIINGSYTYYDSNIFGSFDTCTSTQAKTNYAKDHNMAGVMAWSIETDAAPEHNSLFQAMWNAYDM